MQSKHYTLIAIMACLLAAPLAAAAGGGTVSNKAPTVETFTNGSVTNRAVGDTEVLSGTVRDSNKEADILAIRILRGGVQLSERTIASSDISTTTEPSFASGWKVWNTGGSDGVLSFKFQSVYGATGSFAWTVEVKDEGAYQAGGGTITVTVTERINSPANPFNAAGTELVGAAWGGWTALPGATNVVSGNYIKVTNTGTSATQAFSLDFTDANFTGVNVTGEKIAIDGTPGNIQFSYWEDTSTASTSPEEAGNSYTAFATSNTGGFSASFSGVGNTIWIKYRLLAIPDPLVDQVYQAGFTVNSA